MITVTQLENCTILPQDKIDAVVDVLKKHHELSEITSLRYYYPLADNAIFLEYSIKNLGDNRLHVHGVKIQNNLEYIPNAEYVHTYELGGVTPTGNKPSTDRDAAIKKYSSK